MSDEAEDCPVRTKREGKPDTRQAEEQHGRPQGLRVAIEALRSFSAPSTMNYDDALDIEAAYRRCADYLEALAPKQDSGAVAGPADSASPAEPKQTTTSSSFKPFKTDIGERLIAWWPPGVVANGWQPYDQPHPDAYMPHGSEAFDRFDVAGGLLLVQRVEALAPKRNLDTSVKSGPPHRCGADPGDTCPSCDRPGEPLDRGSETAAIRAMMREANLAGTEKVRATRDALAESAQKAAPPITGSGLRGRWNAYRCDVCQLYTVTIDVDEGVTPFMLRCRATGKEGDCAGFARSLCYPKGERPADFPEPAWEWFKPTPEEYARLDAWTKEHVDKGGLDLRQIQVCSGSTPSGCKERSP